MHFNKKILVLGNYPIAKPQHGGQKRTRALVDFYKPLFAEVKYVGIYHRGHHNSQGADDILLGQPDIIAQVDKDPHQSEFVIGMSPDIDIHVRSHLAKMLMDYQPDIIQIEQAYLYAGVTVLLRELNMRPRLVFSSQNVEYKLKREIFEELGIKEDVIAPLVAQVKAIETTFSRQADLVIAVSQEDADAHKAMGAKRCVVAPNGIEKSHATAAAKQHWKTVAAKQKVKQIVAFIGSGHPPNWMGFLQMVGDNPSFVPKTAKIFMAGGISEYFKKEYAYKAHKKPLWNYVEPLGFLSEDHLVGLLESSDVVLLPITAGGGTNLKTAEAILSGKKVVATHYAFRGFERYKNLPNIYISNDPSEFKDLIVQALDAPLQKRSTEEVNLAEQVQWKHCLMPVVPAMKRMTRQSLRARVGQKAVASRRVLGTHARRVLKRG